MGTNINSEDMLEKISGLTTRIERMEAIHDVRCLHFKYGYYLERRMVKEVMELFCEDCEVRNGEKVYLGKAGAERIYERLRVERRQGGFLADHLMAQDVIDVSPDLKSAKGRFRALIQIGLHEISVGQADATQKWMGCIYENTYINESGVWKIKKLAVYPVWEAAYGEDLSKSHRSSGDDADASCFPNNPVGPDRIEASVRLFPHNKTVPFHYSHPVTGEISPDDDF